MILGIGTDLANIDRIANTLDRFGDRFRNRVFTETEQAKAERRRDTAGPYAKRWAAKAARSTAPGPGLPRGVAARDGPGTPAARARSLCALLRPRSFRAASPG